MKAGIFFWEIVLEYSISTCDENGDILIMLFPKDILWETLKNNHSKCVKLNGY